MVNDRHEIVSDKFTAAFEAGFLNAARAFSQLAATKVICDDFQCGTRNINALNLDEQYSDYSKIPKYLLTTEVFGDITGKCYLCFSQVDFDYLTRSIPEARQASIDLRSEFIKELDNILSAAVVTQLSNGLNRKMFGDIPMLVGKVNSRLNDVVYDDFSEQTETVCVNSIHFTFKDRPDIRPLFIWVFDTTILEQTGYKGISEKQ